MPIKVRTSLCGAAALALGAVLSAGPAFAGFQWSEPGDAGSSQVPAPDLSAVASPVVISGPENAAPVVISGSSAPSSTAGQTLSFGKTSGTPSQADPVKTSPAVVVPDLSTETISVASTSGGQIVQGFGSGVPLTLALRQVLPPDYSFNVDPSVDMGTLVSYKGGKPWRETLALMLAAAELEGQVQGNVVSVRRLGGAVQAPSPSLSNLSAAPASQSMRLTIPDPKAPETLGVLTSSPSGDLGMSDISSSEVWLAQRGDTLHKVLTAWCGRAGIELKWLAEYDYPIEASSRFSGTFEDAVRGLFVGFDGARPQPIGELHTNSRVGQNVLVVQARGNSYTN